MNKEQRLSSSQQNYLKAIYSIIKEKQVVKVKDISKYLGLGPSSVSEALRSLADKGYINYEPYGAITLKPLGEETACEIIKRHQIIFNFFENVLLVDKDDAESSSSKVEHEISDNVLDKFVRFLEFMQTCSCKEPKWMKSFKYYSEKGDYQEKCKKCISTSQSSPCGFSNSNCCGSGD